jgi:hypothetical protein
MTPPGPAVELIVRGAGWLSVQRLAACPTLQCVTNRAFVVEWLFLLPRIHMRLRR